ncbi:MFS transporter [Woodsholea maritima]|uniref:MFS transporter n=1 Tax=Woodsholea maritima TaxID=240237 RepID=UPI00037F5455|nr:MFS transporter [Woodsholea maritima]
MVVFRRIRRVIAVPPFWLYLMTISAWFFGFGLQTTLFPGVINYTLMESPDKLGLAQAALTAPMLVLLPLTGVIAERYDRRILLAGFHTLAALAALSLFTLMSFGLLSYEMLVAYALCVGIAGAFVMPARDSAINPVIRVSQRLNQNGRSLQKGVIIASLVQFAAQILGMGLGFGASFSGPKYFFALQGVGLLLGGICALLLPRLPSRAVKTDKVLKSLKDGISTVWHSPILGPMTLIMIVVGLLVIGGGFFVIIPVLVRDVYHSGYEVLASLLVTFWVGAFAANVILARLGNIEKPGQALIYSQIITIIALGLFATPLPLWALYGLIFCWGLGAGVAISLSRAIVQENAPAGKLARVMSVYQLGLFGGAPAGAATFGYIVAHLGARQASLIPMIGLSLFMLGIALFSPLMKVTREEPA